MDIQRSVKKKPIWKTYWYVFPIGIVLSLGVWAKSNFGDASYMLLDENIKVATVERGDFVVHVRGTGQLKPSDIRWVSSQVAGRVEQIMVKPGALVSSGDVLATLSNPELQRQLERAKWELDAKKAESQAELVSLQSQLLDIETKASAAHFDYRASKLRYDAETVLIKQGTNTVSELDYQRSEFTYQQHHALWQSELKRIDMLKNKIDATRTAQQARLGLLESSYLQLVDQVQQLQIKASTTGVLQHLSLELGQQAQVGASVAKIAKQEALIAEIQVQELQVREIQVGQSAIIDTRNSKIRGVVSRIDPAVEAGMVQVDIELQDALPQEARPDLNVEARIEVTHIADALFVKRPYFAPSFEQAGVYKLSNQRQRASKVDVQFGHNSVHQIQIVSGLNAGDQIIISDTTAWQQHAEVFIH